MPLYAGGYQNQPGRDYIPWEWVFQNGQWGPPGSQPEPGAAGAVGTGGTGAASGVGALPPITPGAAPNVPTAQTGYNPSPAPVSGSNPFGYIPGQLGLPDPAGDLQKQLPALQGLNAQASGVIGDWLGGNLGQDVLDNIQNAAATFGVRSGMPGAGLQNNKQLLSNILTAHDFQQQGLSALNPFVQSVSATQTLNPAIQAQIAETNAINAAAPDPTQAASYAKQLYDDYLKNLSKGSGQYPGPGSGTGLYAPRLGGGYSARSSGGYGGYDGGYDFYGGGQRQQAGPPPVSGYGGNSYGVLQSDMNPEFGYSGSGYGGSSYLGGTGSLGSFDDPLSNILGPEIMPGGGMDFFNTDPTLEDWAWGDF